MPQERELPPQHRQQTDQSLKTERATTDEEIARRQNSISTTAENVVARARQRADGVLEEARERADQVLVRDGFSTVQRRAVESERAQEDEALQEERLTADNQAQDEREQRERALRTLLLLERLETNERLSLERAGGDALLAARDDFMTMVSHDVRNLLGGIALAAEIQIKTAADDEVGRKAMDTARRIQRFTALINRLLGDLVDVASIEAGRFVVAPSKGDACALVRESLEVLGPFASARRITLEFEEHEGTLEALFDHDRVLQVLANLAGNAIKFTPPEGRVTFRVRPVGDAVEISVQDTGVGLSAEDLTHVFERFWQARRSDVRGMGLGLFISERIIEGHGGQIGATSVPGKGSTFFFTLPAA